MNHCETCVWWDGLDYPTIDEHGDRWGVCRFINDTVSTIPKGDSPHSVRAYTQDASAYASSLQVRSDFGCVEHESEE